MTDKKLPTLIFIVVLGMIIGGILSSVIGAVIPESIPKKFFLASFSPKFGPANLDLYVINLTFGIKFTFNFISLVGLGISSYLFRWYK